ncbi:MAG: hypothetical protein M4579_001243 [Chaenotheca gracillima]|nr:MAG: hypothetical protein M4579_001243 [Chaenotheca gracillima]
MALVVEQTLPFSASQLDLENPDRWNRLFPLIRPSVVNIQSKEGQDILVDKSLLRGNAVQVAAVGSAGNTSSKLFSNKHASAFVTQKEGAKNVKATDIYEALGAAGANIANGVVVIRIGSTRNIQPLTNGSSKLVQIEVAMEVEFDHLLALLAVAKPEIRGSFDKCSELLETFLHNAESVGTTFDVQKVGSRPSVTHSTGPAVFESAKASVGKDLSAVLKSKLAKNGPVTYSVHYADTNGLSRLENYLLAHEISEFFAAQNIPVYTTASTVLDKTSPGRGWLISLCPIPNSLLATQAKPPNSLSNPGSASRTTMAPRKATSPMKLVDGEVRRRLVNGCNALIKEEPIITEYDTIVGDGDCGYTLRDGAKQVLGFIGTQDLAELPQSLSALVDDLEVNMGGTSGALYCIFLSSLAQSLWDAASFADALVDAQNHLLKYTRARLGDRTMLDCLIPFVDTWKATGDLDKALREASQGVEGTKKLEAKLGRSTYLDESATKGVPDPGAYGLLKLLEGIAKA